MSSRDKLTTFLTQLITAKNESDTDYDGPFSHPGEYHAATIGLGVGVSSALLDTPGFGASIILVALGLKGGEKAKERLSKGVVAEVQRESWYSCGGVIIGYAVGLLGKSLGLL